MKDKLGPNLSLEEQELFQIITNISRQSETGYFCGSSLMIKSLLRGVSNEDNFAELTQRLDSLPVRIYSYCIDKCGIAF